MNSNNIKEYHSRKREIQNIEILKTALGWNDAVAKYDELRANDHLSADFDRSNIRHALKKLTPKISCRLTGCLTEGKASPEIGLFFFVLSRY